MVALEILKREADEGPTWPSGGHGWHQLPVPVIAVTQGVCLWRPAMALGADFASAPRIAASVMEIKRGHHPDMSGSVTPGNLMGMDTAMDCHERARAGSQRSQVPGLVSRGARIPLKRRGPLPPDPDHQVAGMHGWGSSSSPRPGLG